MGRVVSVISICGQSQVDERWTTSFPRLTLALLDESGVELTNSTRSGGSLDQRDVRLIALLEADPRASLADLARGLSISPQSVGDRLKRLEDVGVLGFTVKLDPRKLGLPIGAYIRIQPAMG